MQQSKQHPSESARERLFSIIREIGIGMLTTVRADGRLHARPMVTRMEEGGGPLWFFTVDPTAKTDEVGGDRHVAIAYADPKRQVFASVSGSARVVRDRERMRRLWVPTLVTWFPKGAEDPDLALVRVDVRGGEYWETPSSTMVEILAAVQGGLENPPPVDVGDHAKIKM